MNVDVGLLKKYEFQQNLYRGSAVCGPSSATCLTVDAGGDLTTTEDFGQTIIGTLDNFDFSLAYAYIRQTNFKAHISGGIQIHAHVRTQTQMKSLDGHDFGLFGSNYNIKGILRVNPYFDVRAQI